MTTVDSGQLTVNSKTGWGWMALCFALAIWLASCGPRVAYAQVAAGRLVGTETLYAPEENLERMDVAEIDLAQRTIDLAAFSLTDQAVVTALADRAAHGVAVRIYLDRGELQAECRGDATCARIPLHSLIGLKGVEIRVKFSKVLMHLKSYAVDGSLVRDGSANFSEAGERRQDNSATFTTGDETVKSFESKFTAMWFRPDNLTVAQAVTTP
jgi:phosphatidylserine/phosphatidylglycerophosphate/cardiolipin synthase-like enzyme